MKLTDKYNQLFQDMDKPAAQEEKLPGIAPQSSTILKMDPEVLVTEIRSMIAKAYNTDEPNNTQPEKLK